MSIAVKRFLSYVIDMIIVFIFVFFINIMLPNKVDNDINILNQQLLEKKVDMKEYFNNYKHLLHIHDKEDIILNISTTILLISFFVLVPYYFNGQTIGQKIFKIKIVNDDKLKLEDLVARASIVNGIGYMIFMFIILYITNDNLYFILINLLAFLQFLVVIISSFMVSYSYEHLSIADKFTKTRIEEIK